MSFFPIRQSAVILLITLTIVTIESVGAQTTDRSEYSKDLHKNRYDDRLSDENLEHELDLDLETLEQARRTFSHLSPATRRFLFSPTIQNTITNLNQNTNTQDFKDLGDADGTNGSKREGNSEQILGHVNSSGDIEYDLKGKTNKICFILG